MSEEPRPKDMLRTRVQDLHDQANAIAKWMGLSPTFAPYVAQLLGPLGVQKTFAAIQRGSGFPVEYFDAAGVKRKEISAKDELDEMYLEILTNED